IVTNNDKVCRIVVADKNNRGGTDIRIRFNNLCYQFSNNDKYTSFIEDQKISEDEDVHYEIMVNDKRYEAIFYQDLDIKAQEAIISSLITEYMNKYPQDQIEVIGESLMSFENMTTGEQLNLIQSEDLAGEFCREAVMRVMTAKQNKPVWFMISKGALFDQYYITMFYDNEYNRAHGEDL
ncbi:MAG: hypothetical protein J6R27_03430, partial [Muribaculaceae bacterium]|nr:hypothetical protein [Muribaculaceae bacterium]